MNECIYIPHISHIVSRRSLMVRIGACPQSHFKLSYPVTIFAIKVIVRNEKHFQRRGYHFAQTSCTALSPGC